MDEEEQHAFELEVALGVTREPSKYPYQPVVFLKRHDRVGKWGTTYWKLLEELTWHERFDLRAYPDRIYDHCLFDCDDCGYDYKGWRNAGFRVTREEVQKYYPWVIDVDITGWTWYKGKNRKKVMERERERRKKMIERELKKELRLLYGVNPHKELDNKELMME